MSATCCPRAELPTWVQGDMPKRAVVQMEHLEQASQYSTAAAAKEAGNKHFKQAAYNLAVACYSRCVALAVQKGDKKLATIGNSNAAMALIKLSRWADAEVCSPQLLLLQMSLLHVL